jgi:hypothetical protein
MSAAQVLGIILGWFLIAGGLAGFIGAGIRLRNERDPRGLRWDLPVDAGGVVAVAPRGELRRSSIWWIWKWSAAAVLLLVAVSVVHEALSHVNL